MKTIDIVKYAYMVVITLVAMYFYMESSKMNKKIEELEDEIDELTVTKENTSTNTLNGIKNNLSPIISNNNAPSLGAIEPRIKSNVQFGIGKRPRQMRLGKDCDTCVWKLKNSCTIKDENGNRAWDPRCEGNNATKGFICSFKDSKYDVECNDIKCGTHGKGSCNEENLQKMYKKWYVKNV